MSSRRPGVVTALVAGLAMPFVAVNVWLGLAVAAFGMAGAAQGAIGGVAVACAAVLVARAFGSRGVVLAAVLYLAGVLTCAADAVSWIIQGSSFNDRFFAHLNAGNLPVAFEAYPWASLVTVFVLVAVFVAAFMALRRASRHHVARIAGFAALVFVALACVVDAAPRRLYGYFTHAGRTESLANSAYGAHIRSMLDGDPSEPADVVATPGRNLVFVYLESVERTYTDETRFPGLTPNLNRLRAQGLDFSGLATFPGVTYTIAGLFSSQCGAPYLISSIFGDDFGKLGFVPNNDNTTASSFHPELACLGDVLRAAGYDQTFLSGVALSFANKGDFFRMHGFDHLLGKPQIEALHDGKLASQGWGLHDSDLFDEALAQYRRKQASGKPFSVMLSTVDTHPPKGYLLPGCEPYAAIRNAMLDAVHCSDTLLGRFVAQLSAEPGWKDTLVVVMSDHVAMRNAASALYPPDDQRQPLLFVLNAGQGDRPVRMYHMDVAPTVLGLLGVRSNVRFMAGADRGAAGAADATLPADEVAQAVTRRALWEERQPPALCSGNVLVEWDGNGHLDVGGWKLPLMLGGFPVSRIPDPRVLLVFVDAHGAQLQLLSKGQQVPWLKRARERGGSIFEATPFIDADGTSALALNWLAPGGGWASLGKVARVQDIRLQSPQCEHKLRALASARPGTRLDFSDVFGTAAIPAARERRPGFVTSSHIAVGAPPVRASVFMFARLLDERAGTGTVHLNAKKRVALSPSRNREAMAEFDVSGLASLRLEPRIDNLFGRCLQRSDTGVVGVRVSLDGRPVEPRFIVDRQYAGGLDVQVNGGHRLRVEVDHGNATPDCDYFAMGFSSIVTATADATAPTDMEALD
ncbi:sulfatase-like hydrolase/transferase [Frateuria sp. YIM B11624]|uniref:sulfatase-like hydrolase/transferase n=1 Tax=Frateuria sp. YIM B11624 TaxID=3143185 RepID=UPI003C78FE36